MCSNEQLKEAVDELKTVVKENSGEQRETRRSLDGLHATFETWQKTRCDDHHSQLTELKVDVSTVKIDMAKNIGKAAGIMIAIQLVGLLVTYFTFAAKIGDHLVKATGNG